MMKTASKYIVLIAALAALAAVSCSTDTEPAKPATRGVSYIEATLEDWIVANSRASIASDDGWSVTGFTIGDAAGFYCGTGIQNPNDPNDFSFPAINAKMSYEGVSNGGYRFGSSEIVMDPATISTGDYAVMYFPYYADMPGDNEEGAGMLIRKVDERDGIEKCIDIFGTLHYGNSDGSTTISYKLSSSNGVVAPKFYRYCVSLIFQRGEGFDNPADSRIWIVMQNPFSHLKMSRFKQSSNSRYYYDYVPHYYVDESEEEVMIDLMEEYNLPHEYNPDKKLTVNKYAVWQTWQGPDGKIYTTIPPVQSIYYILIQDNNGYWQTVTDFYLRSTGSKSGAYGWRYTLKIELQGVNVVARPVTIGPWDDEVNITDDRKVGMSTPEEYSSWVSTYNSYTQNNRDETYVDALKKYGDVVLNETTGERKWTFYINDNIEFLNNDYFPVIRKLEDKLEGSSTYTNYNISNLRGTLIEEIASGGIVNALNFRDIYLVQQEGADSPYGALAGRMTGGTIENCNITNGVVISDNEVGIIAGEVDGGTVRNCTVSGNVIGSASLGNKGMFGRLTDGGTQPTESGNKTSGLKFIKN